MVSKVSMRVETESRSRLQTRKNSGLRASIRLGFGFSRRYCWVKGSLHVISTSSPGLDDPSAQFQVFFPIV